jgi:hypothetical protein
VNHTRAMRPGKSRIGRRKFFGWFSASVVGGVAGGSLLRRLIRFRPENEEQPVVISQHALSVPRTKKG